MTVDVGVPSATTPADAGRAHRALEPLHSQIYFAPDAEEHLVAVGLRPGRMTYFASRSAPMGQVTSAVVAATFYNFNPELVAKFVPRAWTLATPEAIVAARFAAADVSLRRLLGDDVVASAEVAELAQLTRTAAAAAGVEGRPLFAAHAALPWPDQPHVALWHAVTLLREHRGDGHLMALQGAGLSGIEAIYTHTATGRGFRVDAAKLLRGWSDEQWEGARASLAARGLADDTGGLTAAGSALRAEIEDDTDRLALGPWDALGPEGTARVVELGKPLVRLLAGNGAFPGSVFATPRS